MPINEYLKSLLSQVKKYGVPDWLFDDLSKVARASAGDKMRHKQHSDASEEKINDLNGLVIVKDFISIVGSAAKGDIHPSDIDILIRADADSNGNYSLQGQNIRLPIRNLLDLRKENKLHIIDNPQGTHGDNIPLFDLVLRPKLYSKQEKDDDDGDDKPGTESQKSGISKSENEKENNADNRLETSYEISIAKINNEKQIASFIVTDPYEIDADGHWISPSEAEDFFYAWMEKSRKIKYRHKKEAPAVIVGGWLVPYPSEKDYKAAMANEPHRIYDMMIGNDRAKSGSPIVDIKVTEPSHEIWEQIKNGEINAVSIGGKGIVRPVPKSVMPKIIEVIKIG